jgi:hypothetical protein
VSARRDSSTPDALVLEHAGEDELLGLLRYRRLEPFAEARASAHVDRCTICNFRLERRREELAEGILPEAQWERSAPTVQRFLAPLCLLVSKLGALREAFGPPALPTGYAFATMGEEREERKGWALRDDDQGVTIHLGLRGVRGPGEAVAELTAALEGAASSPAARIEITGTTTTGRPYEVSDRLADIERQGVRLPQGRFVLRIVVGGTPELAWEIPLEAERDA